MTTGERFEVSCIKCGLVDPAVEMMRLAFVTNDDPDDPEELTIAERGIPVWLHKKCWLDYCAIAAQLVSFNLSAMIRRGP
jgi:hypothetical protein